MSAVQHERRQVTDSIAWRLQAEIDAKTFQRKTVERDARRFGAVPVSHSAFAPLQPADSLPARMARIWTAPQVISFEVYDGRDDAELPTFVSVTMNRSEASYYLRACRAGAAYIERRGNVYYVEAT